MFRRPEQRIRERWNVTLTALWSRTDPTDTRQWRCYKCKLGTRTVRNLTPYHSRTETISTKSPEPSKGFATLGYIRTFTTALGAQCFPGRFLFWCGIAYGCHINTLHMSCCGNMERVLDLRVCLSSTTNSRTWAGYNCHSVYKRQYRVRNTAANRKTV